MTGIELIAKEQERQAKKDGFNIHVALDYPAACYAAACYAAPEPIYILLKDAASFEFVDPWPTWWDKSWDNRPKNWRNISKKRRIRNLAKAGALIAAEIDRLLIDQGNKT